MGRSSGYELGPWSTASNSCFHDWTMSVNFACLHILDRLQLPQRLFDLSRCQVFKARNNSTTALCGLVRLPKRKYCRHVFRRSLHRTKADHIVRRRIFDKRMHGCEGLHSDVVVKIRSQRDKIRNHDAALCFDQSCLRQVPQADRIFTRRLVLRELTATYTKIYARISVGPQARGATVTACGRRSVPPRWVPPRSLFGLR